VTLPASRGWTRRGHRVGVVETPTGDVDLHATGPTSPDRGGLRQRPSQVNPDVVSPSAPYRQFWVKKKSPPSSVRRHSEPRDRIHDVKAAILASAAAKLSSTTARVPSPSSSDKSPDWPRTVSSSTARSDCRQTRGTSDVENGTDTSSEDSSRLIRQFDEHSSQSTCSSSSSVSPTTQKPPTGRISTKQTDRRNYDKAASFFRSLLTRPRSPSPSHTNVRSSPTCPDNLPLSDSLVNGQQSGSETTSAGSAVVSSLHYFYVRPSESVTTKQSSDNLAPKLFEQKTSKCNSNSVGTNWIAADSNDKSGLERCEPSAADCSESENSAVSTSSNDYPDVFTADTGTTNFVIKDPSSRTNVELVVNSTAPCKPDLKRSDHQLSVDESPQQSRKVRKVVTFAEERNTGVSLLTLSPPRIGAMNGDVQMESEKPTNNNSMVVRRLATNDSVQLSSVDKSGVSQTDIAVDISNANVIQSDMETTSSTVGGRNFASSKSQDYLQESKSSASDHNDVHKSAAATVNGRESNAVLASEADDSASVSDVESEDLSASQRDLHTLYQQRRAERLEEQKAAELEKQRLEEILKLCTEFGLSSDLPSVSVNDSGSSVVEKSEGRNSLGGIKTNGSLTKLAGLPSSETSSDVERRLSHSGYGSNSDDDVDRGTIQRRPPRATRNPSTLTASNNTLSITSVSDRTASDTDKISRTILGRTSSGTLPTIGTSVESAGRSKSVPVIDTSMTVVDGELDRLLQSNIDFSLPTAADWRVGQSNQSGILKSSLDWYSASLPEYSTIWDSVNTWKSSQHRVSMKYHVPDWMYYDTNSHSSSSLKRPCYSVFRIWIHRTVFNSFNKLLYCATTLGQFSS